MHIGRRQLLKSIISTHFRPQWPWTWVLDLGSGHTAFRRVSLIDLYIHTKFHSNQKNVLCTDGWMDGHWDWLYKVNCQNMTGKLVTVQTKL